MKTPVCWPGAFSSRRGRFASLVALGFVLSGCGRSGPTPAAGQGGNGVDREFREITTAFNVETGARQVSVEELGSWLAGARKNVVLLDVREPEEQDVSVLPGSRRVSPSQVAKLDVRPLNGATVVTYCTVGYRSGRAAVELETRLGQPVYSLDGGIIAWFNAGGDVRDPSGRPAGRIHPYGDEWARFVHPPENGKKPPALDGRAPGERGEGRSDDIDRRRGFPTAELDKEDRS
ncbi:MAG: rhodanese-like domain-containing protein [Planctomycetota bacterium]|nr:rhodanese-like domain-containing protein [Planctomycetota bacterium]